MVATKIELRDYQQVCVEKIRSGIKRGSRKFLVVAPPGAGKGTVISYFAAAAAKKQNRVLLWVHKRELVMELKDRIKKQFGMGSGLILSGEKPDPAKLIQIGSVLTMIRRQYAKPALIITDEAHRILSPSQMKLVNQNSNVILISFTATPTRLDKKRFDEVFEDMVQLSTYRELMNRKFLVPTKVIAPKGIAAIEGVKIRAGDYALKELEERYTSERLYKGLYEQWKEWMDGESTMIFNVGKKHNREVYQYFKDQGEDIAYVDEETPAKLREQLVSDFKSGKLMILCNIAIFSEGVDAPVCTAIVLNYSTKSFAKYVQSAARGSRPIWNEDFTDWKKEHGRYVKTHIKILDMGGNTARHGLLEDYDAFGFDLSAKRLKKPPPMKTCKNCRAMVYSSARKCEHCDYVFPIKSKEDEKMYADEVSFGEMKKEHAVVNRIKDMDYNRIRKAPAEYLRIVAVVKGYRLPTWAYYTMFRRSELDVPDEYKLNELTTFQRLMLRLGEFRTNDGKHLAAFSAALTRVEKEKGTYDLYKNIKLIYGKK